MDELLISFSSPKTRKTDTERNFCFRARRNFGPNTHHRALPEKTWKEGVLGCSAVHGEPSMSPRAKIGGGEEEGKEREVSGMKSLRWTPSKSEVLRRTARVPKVVTLLELAIVCGICIDHGVASEYGLRLLELQVPEAAELGESATLECKFELGGGGEDNLYSVKWYKDDHEFFRYTPDDQPNIQIFPVNGVTLDESESGVTSVTLRDLTFESSGSYRCEVSTEAPDFKTVLLNKYMGVWAPPRSDPAVEGLRQSYSVGDLIAGNCTSASSFPPAALAWFLNGQRVDRFSLEYFSPWPDGAGLQTTRLGLRFRTETDHFLDAPTPASPSAFGRELELRCTASVHGQTRHRVVRALLLAPPSLEDQRPAKIEGGRGRAASNVPPGLPTLAFLLVALLVSPKLLLRGPPLVPHSDPRHRT